MSIDDFSFVNPAILGSAGGLGLILGSQTFKLLTNLISNVKNYQLHEQYLRAYSSGKWWESPDFKALTPAKSSKPGVAYSLYYLWEVHGFESFEFLPEYTRHKSDAKTLNSDAAKPL